MRKRVSPKPRCGRLAERHRSRGCSTRRGEHPGMTSFRLRRQRRGNGVARPQNRRAREGCVGEAVVGTKSGPCRRSAPRWASRRGQPTAEARADQARLIAASHRKGGLRFLYSFAGHRGSFTPCLPGHALRNWPWEILYRHFPALLSNQDTRRRSRVRRGGVNPRTRKRTCESCPKRGLWIVYQQSIHACFERVTGQAVGRLNAPGNLPGITHLRLYNPCVRFPTARQRRLQNSRRQRQLLTPTP